MFLTLVFESHLEACCGYNLLEEYFESSLNEARGSGSFILRPKWVKTNWYRSMARKAFEISKFSKFVLEEDVEESDETTLNTEEDVGGCQSGYRDNAVDRLRVVEEELVSDSDISDEYIDDDTDIPGEFPGQYRAIWGNDK